MVHNHRMMKMKQQQITLSRKNKRTLAKKFPSLNIDQIESVQEDVLGMFTVSLKTAQEILTNHNGINRDLKLNGKEGMLCDGQHRLYASIETGKPQVFTIKVGFDRDKVLANTDTGTTRGDDVKISLMLKFAWAKEKLNKGQWKIINKARKWDQWINSVTSLTTAPQEINTYTSKQTEAKVKAFANKKKKTLIGVAKGSMVREILCQTGGKHGKHKSNYENAALIIGAMQKFLDGEKVNFHTKFNSVHFSK